jgi:L-ascorbate metabolism protein UlaG (beta-lactamase superfamily)
VSSVSALLNLRPFKAFQPPESLRSHGKPADLARAVCIRWLGTAGFLIESAKGSVLIDPYLSRFGLDRLVATRLAPDELVLRRHLPRHLDAIVCGHSHFDHLLDAPLACQLTSAKLLGSPTTMAFAMASGLEPSQLVEIPLQGGEVRLQNLRIRLVPSLHARLLLGKVPFAGELSRPPALPARVWNYRMGGAFGVFVETGGITVYHNGSADLIDAELSGLRADVLLVGLAGRQVTANYLKRLLQALEPTIVVPAHHDAMFAPLEAGVRLLPGIDFEGFVREVRQFLPRAQVFAPLYQERLWVEPSARNAYLAVDP